VTLNRTESIDPAKVIQKIDGASIRYLTPDPVVEYVRSHRLYAKP